MKGGARNQSRDRVQEFSADGRPAERALYVATFPALSCYYAPKPCAKTPEFESEQAQWAILSAPGIRTPLVH